MACGSDLWHHQLRSEHSYIRDPALVEDGDIVASAVPDGGTGELYVAESGRGAWRIEPDGLRHLHVAKGYSLVSIDPDNRGGTGAGDFPIAFAIEALARRRWDVRALASTIALVHLASGRLAGAVYAPLGAALHFCCGRATCHQSWRRYYGPYWRGLEHRQPDSGRCCYPKSPHRTAGSRCRGVRACQSARPEAPTAT
jgi:hypothetical protein